MMRRVLRVDGKRVRVYARRLMMALRGASARCHAARYEALLLCARRDMSGRDVMRYEIDTLCARDIMAR